jgi:lysozyme family protein
MTMKLDDMLEALVGREGRYSNHPSDRGGETMWGITERVARKNGYSGVMSKMPRETAKDIYRKVYWQQPGFDEVAEVWPSIAEELLDTGVNMGTVTAAGFLQRALNALNARATHYPDIAVDGDVGPATLRALRAYKARRGADGESVLLKALNCQQGERYLKIAEGRPANEDFVFGWFRARVA